MSKHKRFLTKAMQATHQSQCKFPMAAAIVKNGKLLSAKPNRMKSHPKQNSREKRGRRLPPLTTHCELAAIIPLSENQLRGSTIYVARRLANGQSGLARPCSACMTIIKAAGIRRMVFTTNGPGYAVEGVEY